ncbi:MAG TPA: DUF4956 domain-containing protein [Pyrinomonadaceae bacterium]|jgi:uncharacterized membrane protein YhiD involved in acid resistance
MRKFRLILISIVTTAILISSLFAVYLLYTRRPNTSIAVVENANTQQLSQASGTPAGGGDNPFLPAASPGQTTESEVIHALEILWRLFLAVVLAGILAFRPRKNVPLFGRNLYVAQTQILLAVVAAALMLIVGDNTARAFAIFAAVSLVRFRTNIKDPKEITVLLISLALGLATGVGRWDLGAILCGFALVLLWVLEYNESEKVFRSMELTVKTRNTEVTNERLRKIFGKYKLEGEIRQIDPADESNPVGCVMYYLNLRLNLSTDFLSERIFDIDAENVEGIEWAQKKGNSSIYQ